MSNESLSRRQFMRGTGAVAGSSALRLTAPALSAAAVAASTAFAQDAAFETLSSAEAREIDAVAARLLPTTETPGAREAGVIYFIDNVLGAQFADMLPLVRGMLPGFQDGIAERFGAGKRFSDLDPTDQDAWLSEQENTPLFGLLRTLTLMGFFAMSKYGGNKDRVGWDLINFEGHGAAVPPFGYYDAEYMKETSDGA